MFVTSPSRQLPPSSHVPTSRVGVRNPRSLLATKAAPHALPTHTTHIRRKLLSLKPGTIVCTSQLLLSSLFLPIEISSTRTL